MTKIGGSPGPVQITPPQQPLAGTAQKSPSLLPQKNSFSPSTAQVPVGTQLSRSVEGGAILKHRSSGPEVRELQQMLNRAGVQPPLEADGKFGPMTETALRSFQTKNNIQIDGKFGPESMGALQRVLGGGSTSQSTSTTQSTQPTGPRLRPGELARASATEQKNLVQEGNTLRQTTPQSPSSTQQTTPLQGPSSTTPTTGFATEPGRVSSGFGASRAERQQQAEDILRANGQWPPQEGRAYAIQIDQDAPPGSASRSDRSDYVRAYTGETSVFRVQDGRLVEQSANGPHRSASHPGQYNTGRSGLDVNGDGAADIAHIRPGVYDYRTRPNGDGRYNPKDNRQFQVARDINHNGVIDGSERDDRFSASGIQIHAGGATRPSSIGCQTMPPSDYSDFQDAVRNANTGGNSDFTYVLVRRPNERFGENRF